MSEASLPQDPHASQYNEGSFIDKLKDVCATAKDDFISSKWSGKVALGSMITMTAYEWGPGNETTMPLIAGRAIEHAQSPVSIAAVTLITGSINAGQQLASGYLARKTVEHYPQTADTIYAIANADKETEGFQSFKKLSTGKKAYYSFFLGSSFNVMREAFVTKNKTPDNLKSVSRRSAMITGAITSSIVATGSAVDLYIDNQTTQEIMSVVKNPLSWLALGSLKIGSDILRSKLSRRKAQVAS